MELWGSFRAALSDDCKVISFDHRGSGHSSRAPRMVTTKSLARDALGLLAHLKVRRTHVFGVSLGGMAATWLSTFAPLVVAKLCLASTPARGIELSHAGLRRDLALARCFLREGGEVEAALVLRILSPAFRAAHGAKVRWILETVRAQPSTRTALLEHALAGLMHDARRALPAVRAETLVLAGEHDALLGTALPRALSSRLPNATFEVIAASGHDITLEQPLSSARRLERFLYR